MMNRIKEKMKQQINSHNKNQGNQVNQKNHGSDNIPQLRFPEFKDEWETKKMADIAKFSKGKGISKSEIAEDGKTECIRYGELYTRYSEVISEVYSKTNVDVKNLVLSEGNDVIIPASGETQIDIATASCVIKKGIALGGDLNIIKTENNGVFLSYYLNNEKKNEIANLAQGISVVHLYSSQLATLSLNIPTLPEQKRIASFFTVLDKKISELKQKKNLLEQYKKGVMQKLFPSTSSGQAPEMRFTDDTSASLSAGKGKDFPKWEKKNLSDLVKIMYGKDQKQIIDENGKYPILGTGGIMGMTNKFLYDKPSVLIGRKGTIDKPVYMDTPFWTVDTLFYTEVFSNTFPKWLFYKFQTINWYLYNEASGVPSLSGSTIYQIAIELPSNEEQTKIATFLSSLDEKINRTENQIQQTEQYKKGLLQKMFV
jgi:type I restriction enzyme, S subunit